MKSPLKIKTVLQKNALYRIVCKYRTISSASIRYGCNFEFLPFKGIWGIAIPENFTNETLYLMKHVVFRNMIHILNNAAGTEIGSRVWELKPKVQKKCGSQKRAKTMPCG